MATSSACVCSAPVIAEPGLALALGAHELSTSSGVWLILATPLCWQLSHLVVLRGLRGVAAVTPSVLTGARYVYGGAILAVAWVESRRGGRVRGIAVAAAHASVGQALDQLTEARIEAGTGDPDAARRYLNRAAAMLAEASREIAQAQQLADAPRPRVVRGSGRAAAGFDVGAAILDIARAGAVVR